MSLYAVDDAFLSSRYTCRHSPPVPHIKSHVRIERAKQNESVAPRVPAKWAKQENDTKWQNPPSTPATPTCKNEYETKKGRKINII